MHFVWQDLFLFFLNVLELIEPFNLEYKKYFLKILGSKNI